MATLDVGGARGRRTVNHDLPLVPFIDFMLCIVAFLLVTAVWSHSSVFDSRADVPGKPQDPPVEPSPTLHVDMRSDDHFTLTWQRGTTVIAEEQVPRVPVANAEGQVRYPALADAVGRSWGTSGIHRAASDPDRDRAILHSGNTAPFDEIVAAMDAVRAVRRAASAPHRSGPFAFDVTFAVD